MNDCGQNFCDTISMDDLRICLFALKVLRAYEKRSIDQLTET